jgi:hypothetical protein
VRISVGNSQCAQHGRILAEESSAITLIGGNM